MSAECLRTYEALICKSDRFASKAAHIDCSEKHGSKAFWLKGSYEFIIIYE